VNVRHRFLTPSRTAGGHVGPRQVEQIVEVLAHLVIESAYRRVRPARFVGVGAQVMEDQEPDLVALGALESQASTDVIPHACIRTRR